MTSTFDKAAYQREYMRKRREAKRQSVTSLAPKPDAVQASDMPRQAFATTLAPRLTPDERLRFVKEAEQTREQFDDFDWRDAAGRKWTIRPAITDDGEVVLIQCASANDFRQMHIAWNAFSRAEAQAAIDLLDEDAIWR